MVAQAQAQAQAQAAKETGLVFDAEAARKVEALYLHPDLVERRRRVRQALAIRPGERVLDIGCGPGFLTGEVAEEVGPNGWVCGVDISVSMLALARGRAAGNAGAAWVDFREGNATALPFPDDSFDAAVATQVYEYVGNMPAALTELHRVLRPGGRAVIVDTDWDTLVWHTTHKERTTRILEAWDEHLADPYLPRTLRPLLKQAGFTVDGPEVISIFNRAHEGYSQGAAGLVTAFVVGRHGITQADADAWLVDLQRLDAEDAYFFSLNQYLFSAVKPSV